MWIDFIRGLSLMTLLLVEIGATVYFLFPVGDPVFKHPGILAGMISTFPIVVILVALITRNT